MSIQVIKVSPEFTDARGSISRIIDQGKIKIRSILVITSKKGSVRANHYHKKEFHYIYCVSGKFKYSEKNANKTGAKTSSVVLVQGDLVLTKPMVIHSMEFIADSVFMAFTSQPRTKKTYEKDTKRVSLS